MNRIKCFGCGRWHTTYHLTPKDAVWPYCGGTPWCPDCCPRCKPGGSAYQRPVTPQEEEILGSCRATVDAYREAGVFTPLGSNLEATAPSQMPSGGLGQPIRQRQRRQL